jgi:hypothetical protein
MDHLKIYNQIIQRALNRPIQGYVEKHHITPKCLGGQNDNSNLVVLTAREHFVCHWLLHRAYPQNRKLAIAFDRMAKGGNKKQPRYIPSSRAIAEAREASSKAREGVKRPSVSTKLKGRPVTAETLKRRANSRKRNNTARRMSVRMSGCNNPMYGSKRGDRSLLNIQTKSKKCVIDGILYLGVGIASRELSIPHKTLLNRIHSKNFPTYTWFLD